MKRSFSVYKQRKIVALFVCTCLLYGGYSYGWWDTFKKYLGFQVQKTKTMQELEQEDLRLEQEDLKLEQEIEQIGQESATIKRNIEKIEQEQEDLEKLFSDVKEKLENSSALVLKEYKKKPDNKLADALDANEDYILDRFEESVEDSLEFNAYQKDIKKLLELIYTKYLEIIDGFDKKRSVKQKVLVEQLPYSTQKSKLKVAQENLNSIKNWAKEKVLKVGIKTLNLRVKVAKEYLQEVTDPALLKQKKQMLKDIDDNAKKVEVVIKKAEARQLK
ncbi:hypothetical protein KAH94_01305 [bacterium]|nr:hypothetical protein [bacterium]